MRDHAVLPQRVAYAPIVKGMLSLKIRGIENVIDTKAWLFRALTFSIRRRVCDNIYIPSWGGVWRPTNEMDGYANGWWQGFGKRGIKDLPFC